MKPVLFGDRGRTLERKRTNIPGHRDVSADRKHGCRTREAGDKSQAGRFVQGDENYTA